MNFTLRASSATFSALLVAGGLLVASCSGGTTTPAAPSTAATTQSIPTGGGTLALPAAANGESATVTVGAGATAGTTITASSSTTAPAGAPAPSSIRRVESIAGAVPFLYVTFTVNQSVAANLITGESVAIFNSFPANASYYVEFDDVTVAPGTKLGCAGPGTVQSLVAGISNSAPSGACSGGNVTTLVANHTYAMQFYYVPATLAAFPCGSAPPTAAGTLSNITDLAPANYPALGSCSSSITFQSGTTIAGGTTVNVTTSLTLPVGAPTPLPTSPASPGATPQAVVYETLNVTAGSITINTGLTAAPLQTLTYANTGTCSTFAQSFAATGGSWQGASAGTRNGLTITFPAGQSGNTQVLNTAGSPYWIAFLCY